ncbi:MAG: ABC transporter permease [Actinomycetota bacterium]
MSVNTDNLGQSETNLKSVFSDYFARIKAGDIGALPAFLGLFTLGLVFTVSSVFFLTARNMANLITQAAPVMVIAMGLVFVLLLGEIDLSAGFSSGVCGATLVLLINDHHFPWWVALLISILVGIGLGWIMGALVAMLRIPSFVVTLSAFLAFQGVLLLMAGEGGTISLQNRFIIAVENNNLTPIVSWLFSLICLALYVGIGLNRILQQRRNHLKSELFQVWLAKNVILVIGVVGFTYVLNTERGNPPDNSIKGMPHCCPSSLSDSCCRNICLNRTVFGRHLYAVGGNAEAARRSGINVRRVRTLAFVICTGLSAIAGMLFASISNSISPTTGGGTTLLYAVGAAVIGGTSLFGGKGKLRDAVLGGLVVAVINNGMGLLGFSSGTQYLVTGGVLLISASVDAISRKGANVSN